jgi:nucleoside-diphosphate-sugar epimerase
MQVLVTGGTGVVGTATVSALLNRGHTVRLLSRHAERDARAWPSGVTAVPGDVADAATIADAAEGCDAVVHIAGIVRESPPDVTFERVNIEGTRNIVREAERAGARRFVYLSSLGSEHGRSSYHRSKWDGEEIVRAFRGERVIVRPGAVYGPGDGHLSMLLKWVRTLPVVPIVGDGEQPMQPLWHEDAGEAIALAVEGQDLAGGEYDIAGTEVTTTRDVIERLRRLTNRSSPSLPVPDFLAQIGIKAAELVGVDFGVSESQIQMLVEGSTLDAGDNAITRIFGITPLSLDEGLRRLVDAQPELLPDEGVGPLTRKRFWVDIVGSRFDAERLIDFVRLNFARLAPAIMAAGAEPGSPTIVEEGATLTLDLPLRGHVQVRVVEVDEQRFTLMTLDGHPLAGAVRIQSESPRTDTVRLEIQAYERAASLPDLLLMRSLGGVLQNHAWTQLLENVAQEAGGKSGEVNQASEKLSDSEAAVVQRWAEELVAMRAG